MKRFLHYYHIFVVFVLLAAPAEALGLWREVLPGDAVRLPEDLSFKRDYRIQWWYLTGHLFDRTGREFGYELTFFAAGVQQRAYRSRFGVDVLYLSHFAISDIEGRRFYHFSNADSGAYGFAGADTRGLKVWVDKSSLEGSIDRLRISARAESISLDLSLVSLKRAVLHGDNGYSRKSETSPLIASLYFSFTDLQAEGTLAIAGGVFSVSGKSWFDREIYSRGLAAHQAGWDWFSLQLDDGREIMLYEIRKQDGSPDSASSGTVVSREGTARQLKKSDFDVRVLDHYRSERTGIRYPSRWEIVIPSENLSLLIVPLLQDQEFTDDNIIRKPYWEGTCTVGGSASGRAYVEMTGY
jgi:predicted secreted hydrolase